jgi:uncharacterized protein (DUF1501 family)
MNRRELIKALAAMPLLTAAGRLWAAPGANVKPNQPRLLVVFLRGGYDAANLLVPVSSQFYYDARPTIAVPRPLASGEPGPAAAIALNADWGLHPALRDSVYPLFQAGQAAFIPFAGTDDLTRSHFETQDSIELGQPLKGSRDYRSGFLNRLAATLTGDNAIAFTDQLPLIMQGGAQVPNTSLRSTGKPALDARQSAVIAAMYQQTGLARQVSEGFVVRDDVAREMIGEMAAANRNAISTQGFELQARRIARLMKDKYHIGFVDVGGWDTHVGQGAAAGYLAGRFDELGKGLAGFAQEMGPDWNDTTVVVVSEFGRTFRENGNRGTDHGHGSVYWVLGGGVRGGRVAGEQVQVSQATLFQNRDYPVLNEYRAVFAGLFARMYGLNAGQLDHIFSGVTAKDIGLV